MVRVEKGQYILKKDHVITAQNLKAMQAMRLAAVAYTPSQMLGRIVFVLVVTIAAIVSMYRAFADSKRVWQYLLLFLTGTLATQALTYVVLTLVSGKGFVSLDPFLPLYPLPILISLVTNRKRAGMIAAVLIGCQALLLASSTGLTFFVVVAICASGIYFIRFVSRRIDMVFQWFFSIVCAASIILVSNLSNGLGFHHVLQSIMAVVANLSLTYVAVTLLLPLLEESETFPPPSA
jgi:membrane-associated HD superfamily phosphohydrolase